jgi:ribosomal protein S18 acetylase RimI-like enzyme
MSSNFMPNLNRVFFKSETDLEEISAFFAEKLALPENHFRIADGDDGLSGYVWFEVQTRAETPLTLARKRIYIHHVSVQSGARGRGVGSALWMCRTSSCQRWLFFKMLGAAR